MLRITIAEMTTEQRWTLEGRLVGPWVAELRTCWKKRHRSQNGRTCTVDLSGVTFIDKGGQRLLQTMSREGTQFIATGMYIKHVLDQFKPNGKRGLLKVISCLFGALLGGVIVPSRYLQATQEPPRTNAVRAQPAHSIQPISGRESQQPVFPESEKGAKLCQLNSQTR